MLSAAILAPAAHVLAAQVHPSELQGLSKHAKRFGAVPVLVHLFPTTLQQVKDQSPALKAVSERRAEQLYAELGSDAWQAGRWTNHVGQVVFYVTPRGLDKLAASTSALAFGPWQHWAESAGHVAADGAHRLLDQQLAAQGYADVRVVLDVPGMAQTLQRDGSSRFTAPTSSAAAVAAEFASQLRQMSPAELPAKAQALAHADVLTTGRTGAEATLRVSAEGLVRLAHNPLVMSLRPAQTAAVTAPAVEASALEAAQRTGVADVILTLRNPYLTGRLNRERSQAFAAANKQGLQAVLDEHNLKPSRRKDFLEFGAVSLTLSLAELERISVSTDGRVQSIAHNRPKGTTQLATSTQSMNLPWAWNPPNNFRGAGQNIMVFDSGTVNNHPFYAGRVPFEACFGTNQGTFVTICPQQDANGDSPLGLIGSAAPPVGAPFCTADPSACGHGTHVAGAAAGRFTAGAPAGTQGTAPDANLMAIQVFSFDSQGASAPRWFMADLLAALQAAANLVQGRQPQDTPYTINMSFGSFDLHPFSCTQGVAPWVAAVATLRQAGVPVVTSTGNQASDNAITFPACMPGVIKVSSVVNNVAANTRSFFGPVNGANVISDVFTFGGGAFFLAPGGGAPGAGGAMTGVVSSFAPTPPYGQLAGTSMAAPQIAGMYAVYKAVQPTHTVDMATAWLQSPTHSILVELTSRTGAPLGMAYRRPRLNGGNP